MQPSHPLIQPVSLTLPRLPAELEGLRIVHLTDLHITGPTRRHKLIIKLLGAIKADLILLTGDYMTHPGDEDAAAKVMRELASHFHSRYGTFGVFGNHDTTTLRDQLTDLPVHWLCNQTHALADLPVVITGMETLKYVYPDSVAMLDEKSEHAPDKLHLMLCHHPTYLPVAADLRMDMMFAGHTHGGQCRLPFKRALLNSTDLPMHLTSGVLRHRDTLGLVSRGLGEVHLPVRVLCPPQLPIYELKRGPLPGSHSHHVENHQPW